MSAPRLLLIGGGHSHALVLAEFAKRPLPETTEVTVVCPTRLTPYSGMLPGHIAGHYTEDEMHIDLAPLCAAAGARFVERRVTALDLDARRATLEDGPELPFDVASLNIGVTPKLAAPGAAEHSLPVKPISTLLPRLNPFLHRAAQANAPLPVAVVGGGAAGVELAMALTHRLNREAERVALTLFAGEHGILPGNKPGARRRLARHLATQGITVVDRRVVEVGADHVVSDDGAAQRTRHTAAVTLWVTQASAAAWPEQSGLAVDKRGFVLVDHHLRSLSHPFVFAVGDISHMRGEEREKAGVFAVRAGPPLAGNLRRVLQGEPTEPYTPQRRYLSLISTGGKHAVAAYGPFSAEGRWVWWWKDWLDRSFMRRFPAAQETPQAQIS